jgi:hypothetical protein
MTTPHVDRSMVTALWVAISVGVGLTALLMGSALLTHGDVDHVCNNSLPA